MARRVSLPAADDLFRPTAGGDDQDSPAGKPESPVRVVAQVAGVPDVAETEPRDAKKGASGRIKHDEKMTVYVTAAELLDLERTRLELRGEHGLAVDRGRLVREAIDLVLADFHAKGADSLLVRSLLDG